MNRQGLIEKIIAGSKLSRSEVGGALAALFAVVERTLAKGERLILSDFGSFEVAKTAPRILPHPRRVGAKITSPGRSIVKFHPAWKFRSLIATKLPFPREEFRRLAKPVAVRLVDLSKIEIPKEVLQKVPENIARHHQVVPIGERDGKLVLAMVNPQDRKVIEFVRKRTGMEVIPAQAAASDIARVLERYYGFGLELARALREEEKPAPVRERAVEVTPVGAPTVRIVNSLLRRGLSDRASDIHIEPKEREATVRFRVDGVLHKVLSLPIEIQPAIVARIKVLANLKIDETRIPQDGRFSVTIERREVDFRVSVMPTIWGEKAAIRILDKSAGILSLEELGLEGEAFEKVDEAIHKAHGATFVCGPTGSGKTTTLYAVLDRIDDVGINIVTLEDPVEYRIEGVNQSQVNPEIGFTFARGLRSIVRQDPDVIMVGEVRDSETARLAIHAALTGHIVLSTLHTNDAAGAIPRLIDMAIEPFLIASSTNGVIAQRLCRRLCNDCKLARPSAEVPPEIQREIAMLPRALIPSQPALARPGGCPRCGGTGYKGRIGIFEVLAIGEKIKMLTVEKAGASEIQRAAIREGMVTLRQDGFRKALQGLTTIEEVLRVTKE